MDNFIYIGYRMDCDVKDSVEDLDRFRGLKKVGFSIDALPGEDWMFWTHVKCHTMNPENIISVLYRQLIEMFPRVNITWGIFLGLG